MPQRVDTRDGRYYPVLLDKVEHHFWSVTTILSSMINRPGVLLWYGRLGTEEAERQKDDARIVGVKAHDLIERIELGGKVEEPEWNRLDKRVQQALMAYVRWTLATEWKPISAEQVVYSLKYRYAGTLDAIGQIGNRIVLADWKTAGALWPEYKLQVAAYYMAHREMHPEQKIHEARCVRFDKDKGIPEEMIMTHRELRAAFKAFLGVLEAWEYLRGGNHDNR